MIFGKLLSQPNEKMAASSTSTVTVGVDGGVSAAGQGVPAGTPTLNVRYQSNRVTVYQKMRTWVIITSRIYKLLLAGKSVESCNGFCCVRYDAPPWHVTSRARC
ncbi:lipoy [Sesbania bispinosa]|nr:lipoy [Sesbania bispinosa]